MNAALALPRTAARQPDTFAQSANPRTFRWQCERCGYLNDTPAPAEDYPDPDYLYDQMREEQLFGHL